MSMSGKFEFPSGKCQGILFPSERGNPVFAQNIMGTTASQQSQAIKCDCETIMQNSRSDIFNVADLRTLEILQ